MCPFNASRASRLRVVWRPPSPVSLLLPQVSTCRPDHAPLRPHTPHKQLVLLLLVLLLIAFLSSSYPRALCATSSLFTPSSRRCRAPSPSCHCASDFAANNVPADLPASQCTPCTVLNDCCVTYNYRVSDFAHERASSIAVALRFPPACRTLRGDVQFPHALDLTFPATSSICVRSLSY